MKTPGRTVPGLVQLADVGQLCKADTDLPLRLAVIAAGNDLEPEVRVAVGDGIRRSVEHAFAAPEMSRGYVRAHSQEMSDAVCDWQIALSVNEFLRDLGEDGRRAIDALLERSRPLGLLPG